jgi:hypothetical protein
VKACESIPGSSREHRNHPINVTTAMNQKEDEDKKDTHSISVRVQINFEPMFFREDANGIDHEIILIASASHVSMRLLVEYSGWLRVSGRRDIALGISEPTCHWFLSSLFWSPFDTRLWDLARLGFLRKHDRSLNQ